MMAFLSDSSAHVVWVVVGTLGATLFYSRFLVQWVASEREGRSVVPVSFWYLSSIGTIALLLYALAIRSPLGALSQCFNIVVYTRNLVHIARNRNALRQSGALVFQSVAGAVALVAIVLAFQLWMQELRIYPGASAESGGASRWWLAAGLVGQVLFACRFLIQWIATERRGESVIPPSFWYLSVVASGLQFACFAQRAEWIFATGMAVTILIYLRNIMLLGAAKTGEQIA